MTAAWTLTAMGVFVGGIALITAFHQFLIAPGVRARQERRLQRRERRIDQALTQLDLAVDRMDRPAIRYFSRQLERLMEVR